MQAPNVVQLAECAFCHYTGSYDDVVLHISENHDDQEDQEEVGETEESMAASSETCDTEDCQNNEGACTWTDGETKLLLDKYGCYLNTVGPMKKFKRKRDMWQQISVDLKEILNITRSPLQCENRYKTIMKRRKRAVDSNRSTGTERQDVPYESELNKISAMDDSILPEVCTDGINVVTKSVPEPEKIRKRKREKSIQDVLIEIHNKKEEAKERRHRERLDNMRDILGEFFKKGKEK